MGLVMDVQNRTCPEYVKLKVAVLNCQCRADKRKQVIDDQALACQTKACCACCANYNIYMYMYVFLINLPVQNTSFDLKKKNDKRVFPYLICRGNVFRLRRTDQRRPNW